MSSGEADEGAVMAAEQRGLVRLSDQRDEHGPGAGFGPASICRIAAQVAKELATVHARGATFGPFEPSDVAVDLVEERVVLLAAAGGAPDAASSTMPTAGSVAGSDTVADDLYALGAFVYELCAGAPPDAVPLDDIPHSDRADRTPLGHFGLPERPSGLPEPLWCVIECLLDAEPAHRPGGAAQVEAQFSVLAITLADDGATDGDTGDSTQSPLPAHAPDTLTAGNNGSALATSDAAGGGAADGEPVYRLSADDPHHDPDRASWPGRPSWPARKVPAGIGSRIGPGDRSRPARGVLARLHMAGAVALLALLAVVSFGVTWLALSAREHSTQQNVSVQVEQPRATGEPLRTIEPAGLYAP